MRRIAALTAALLLLASAPPPAEQPPSAGCAAIRAYSEARQGLAVLILKDGRAICEAYAPETSASTALPLYSGSKSFVGAMAVLAADDGLLDLDERVSATLPEWRDGTPREAITLRQLLSLVSGIESVIGRPPGFAEAVAAAPASPPGTRFAYGPAPFQIFGEVMRRKLKARGLADDPVVWLQKRLFTPIGVANAFWRRTAEGDSLLPQGLLLTAADWARFGEWVRHDGKAAGKPLLRADRLSAFSTGSPAFAGYGLTWWLPPRLTTPELRAAMPRAAGRLDFDNATALPADLLMAAGAGDQRLYVSKSRGLTIVRFARLSLRGLAGARAGGPEWSDGEFLRLVLELR